MKVSTPEAAQLLLEGSLAFAEMEKNGMRIDVPYLEQSILEVKERIKGLEEKLRESDVYRVWRRRYGTKTNLESRPQLGKVLFEDLGFKSEMKTRTGRDSTDKSLLDKINIPFVKDYILWEELDKLLVTNLMGIKRELVGEFIHPFFHLHTTISMRGSSSEINFQNIPNRNQTLAAIVRKCFIPREGNVLLEIDFKTLEVAVAAIITGDPTLLGYVTDPNKDMHRDTAEKLFFLPQDFLIEHKAWAKKTVRDWSKNRMVFPQFYGSVYFQCAPHLWEVITDRKIQVPELNISVRKHLKNNGINSLGECEPGLPPRKGTFEAHVKSVEDDFWNVRFPVYTQKKKEWWGNYLKEGGQQLATGFYLKGVYRRNQIINQQIQGPSFHCCLWTIIQLNKWLKKQKLKTKLIGSIHDCLNIDSPESEWKDVLAKTEDIVKNDLPQHWPWLTAPLSVEAEMSPENWFQKEPVSL